MEWLVFHLECVVEISLDKSTGMAKSIAVWLSSVIGKDRAILAVIVSCAALTYGGISLFVVVFAIYPLALNLFREANISRKILPGVIALGALTFTMTAIPGTPQIQNLIPMEHFHTPPTAAPIMGISAALTMFILGYLYPKHRAEKLAAKGEVFVEPVGEHESEKSEKLPSPLVSALPMIFVIVAFNAFGLPIIPALLGAILIILATNYIKYKDFIKAINAGAGGSLIAIMNTSAAVGFGSVVQAVPAFGALADMLFNIPGSPLISVSVAVTLLAGATGSASGGMGIALSALGEQYYQLAIQTGISPEAFHRVASIASGGLDTLPHNGAVLTVFAITGMTHKDSYREVGMVACVIPIVALAVAILLGSLGIY